MSGSEVVACTGQLQFDMLRDQMASNVTVLNACAAFGLSSCITHTNTLMKMPIASWGDQAFSPVLH